MSEIDAPRTGKRRTGCCRRTTHPLVLAVWWLIDKSGNVRQRWEGEPGDGGAKKLSAVIDELRKEPSPKGK